MPEGEGESPHGALTPHRNTQQVTERTEGNLPAPLMDVFGKLSETPAGEDPAFWPIHVLNEINYYILHREHASNKPGLWGVPPREIGEKYAPIQENIRRVKTAYEILAYPHCKDWGRRDNIEAELETDRQSFGRDQIELSDAELNILGKLTVARKLSFDPTKRVYAYAEVPISDFVDPFGRRHMKTEEIRRWIAQESAEPTK